jgi:lipoyl(octanoyl) transferase
MKAAILRALDPAEFGLTAADFEDLDTRTVVATKWSWDYAAAHRFQRRALSLVQETPHLRILVCCSHPEVLTNGRGLQKPRKGEVLDLIPFDPGAHRNLPYPLFQIERGGGLTFHHPDQFIFYPILKLNPTALSLSRMIDEIFDFSAAVLGGWGITGLGHENQLLGLWHGDRKLASMGIAIEKLTTFHGMALNLRENPAMIRAMAALNPCGLRAETYTAAESLGPLPAHAPERFRREFLQRIHDEWK